MLSYEKQRQLLVVGILGMILVIIIAIVALILIWRPEPETKKEFKVGVVDTIRITEDDMLKEYYDRIKLMLEQSDVAGLSNLVSEDYYEYTGKTKEDIKKYLEESKMMGKSIMLENGQIYSVTGYNNIYMLDLRAEGEIYSMNIVVREVAPEKYSIAFDKFIDYKEDVYVGSANSVELRAIKRTRFTSSLSYRLRLTNNYHDMIKLNAIKGANPVPLVSSTSQSAKLPMMCTIANQSLEIPSGMAREIEVKYSISDPADYRNYNVIVVSDVEYEGIEGTSGLEYYLNK